MGMAVMTVMGAVMYLAAPFMIGIMTPDARSFRWRFGCALEALPSLVCGGLVSTGCLCRGRRYAYTRLDEPGEHLGGAAHTGSVAGSYPWGAGGVG